MSSLKQTDKSPYWLSLSDRLAPADEQGSDEQYREFTEPLPTGSDELVAIGGLSRRRFVQLMGASTALATQANCRWPKEKILPHTRKPEGHIPGVPVPYATAMELEGYVLPLLANSYDGRPIKLEGNKKHSFSKGGTTTFAQASILNLYDPDRSQKPVSLSAGQATAQMMGLFDDGVREIVARASSKQGAGLRILAQPSFAPSLLQLRTKLLAQYPKCKWLSYEPWHQDNVLDGSMQAFGQAVRSHYHLEHGRVLLTLDADCLVQGPQAVALAAAFAARRDPSLGSEMLRMYSVESTYTATGAQSDHRLPLRSEQIPALLLALLQQVCRQKPEAIPAVREQLLQVSLPAWLQAGPIERFVKALVQDLVHYGPAAVVIPGAGQSAQVHALVHYLHAALATSEQLLTYSALEFTDRSGPGVLAELVAEIEQGEVDSLLILGGNPVYTAPAALHFAQALSKIKTSIHLSPYRDETSQLCTWHVPESHYLEAWADGRSYDGTICVAQPLIEPLYSSKSSLELLLQLLGEEGARPKDLIRQTVLDVVGPVIDNDKAYHEILANGFVPNTAFSWLKPVLQPIADLALPARSLEPSVGNGALELTFWPDSHTFDGRFANNAWLQELPDFMTKLTWDNALLISPKDAAQFGLKQESVVSLRCADGSIECAVFILPGQAQGSLAITIGHGREEAGQVGGSLIHHAPSTGFNTSKLLSSKQQQNYVGGVQVQAEGRTYRLATTQEHTAINTFAQQAVEGRRGEIIREADIGTFEHEPTFAQEMVEHPPLQSLWSAWDYSKGYQWGMAIDLNGCVGCNACVIACQAENNIPVVGKAQVIRGRAMHWLRIDRYFSGDIDAPKVVAQAMMCQHCENAPCEQVCPVAATVHDEEGLNVMVYNRCVGTRYCSNNCPYKVRRFNYFNYHKKLREPEQHVRKMVFNPEVTVRARGVMEKCTYCTQRIQIAKIKARNERRVLADGEIVTACSQACPTGAIVFGNLNDPSSRVVQQQQNPRNYGVLAELNTQPRTTYLAKINNPNPTLVG